MWWGKVGVWGTDNRGSGRSACGWRCPIREGSSGRSHPWVLFAARHVLLRVYFQSQTLLWFGVIGGLRDDKDYSS